MSDGVEVARVAQVVAAVNKTSVGLILTGNFSITFLLKARFKLRENLLRQSLFFRCRRLLFGLRYEDLEQWLGFFGRLRLNKLEETAGDS